MTLATLDIAILVLYIVVALSLGMLVSSKAQTDEDLFLAGRKLSWWAIGLSLFASNISSSTMVGLAGEAYSNGIAVFNYEWMASVVLVVFVLYFAPMYFSSRISTIPELLEKRYNQATRLYLSGLSIVTNVVVDSAGCLYAGALVLQALFPQLDIYTTCFAVAFIAGIYTVAGGLAAVVYTDVLQATVLLIGSGLVMLLLFFHPVIGGSWSFVSQNTPADMLSLIRPLDDPSVPWLGTLTGVPIVGFYFWCSNQFIAQRLLGARSINDARWGALLAGFLKLPVLFLMVFPGTMARLVFPDLQGDEVFPTLITQLLPVGVRGLVLAALIAAIMSSIDSMLNSVSTMVTLDFIKPRYPNLSDKSYLLIGRVTVIIFMIVAATWASQISHFKGLFDYLQRMLAYIAPPVVVLFFPGMFWTWGKKNAAPIMLIVSHSAAVTVFILQQLGMIPKIHFTIAAGILYLFSLVLFAGLSLIFKNRVSVVADLSSMEEGDKVQRWRNLYIPSIVLLMATATLVISFW